MPQLKVIIHELTSLPERVGHIHTPSPSIVVHVGSGRYETKTSIKPGDVAYFEETTVFIWDGNCSIAVDAYSRKQCFAKAFIKIQELLAGSDRFSGFITLVAQSGCSSSPRLRLSLIQYEEGDPQSLSHTSTPNFAVQTMYPPPLYPAIYAPYAVLPPSGVPIPQLYYPAPPYSDFGVYPQNYATSEQFSSCGRDTSLTED